MNIDPAYDVFKQALGEKLVFVETFRSLTRAEQHVMSLGAAPAGEKYLICGVRQAKFLWSLAG